MLIPKGWVAKSHCTLSPIPFLRTPSVEQNGLLHNSLEVASPHTSNIILLDFYIVLQKCSFNLFKLPTCENRVSCIAFAKLATVISSLHCRRIPPAIRRLFCATELPLYSVHYPSNMHRHQNWQQSNWQQQQDGFGIRADVDYSTNKNYEHQFIHLY